MRAEPDYEPFWNCSRATSATPALIDARNGVVLSYAQLSCAVESAADALGRARKSLVLLFANNDIASVVCYLGALRAGQAVFISPVGIDHENATALIDCYRPEIVLWKSGPWRTSVGADYDVPTELATYQMARRREIRDPPPHESLGLVLCTSGSSGGSKVVRLPGVGLSDTAVRIAEALGMGEDDRVLAALPMGYVYGLSVLNSTLQSGGALVFAGGSVADKGFWHRAGSVGVTTIPAVSQTIDLMRRHGVDRERMPTLRKLTHSGSSLDADLFAWAYDRLSRHSVGVYLMYGQTEAGGRMTVLQPEHLPGASGSVGVPLRSCEIRISARGEVLFRGPGVMLGYATDRAGLARAGDVGEFLNTGDIGYLDGHGFLHLRGRASRDRKVFGKRINLDEVEAVAGRSARVAAVEQDGVICIFFEAAVRTDAPSMLQLARYFQVPPQSFRLVPIARLPCTARGKTAYERLTQLASESLPVCSARSDRAFPM